METVCQAACAFPFWEAVSMPVDISLQVGKYLIKSMILFERSGKGLRNWISLGWTREVGSSTHSQLGEGEVLEFFKFFFLKLLLHSGIFPKVFLLLLNSIWDLELRVF